MLGDRAVGPSLAGIKDEIDLSILMEAVRTVFAKGTTRLTQQEAAATMQAFATAKQAQPAPRIAKKAMRSWPRTTPKRA